ncbi:MAG: family putative aminoglycoside O-phosphotransferase [Phenylobacterium sp.]|nr:family putative aminoglycoside O-phosphotransferase [Phenylobacterium sp.]
MGEASTSFAPWLARWELQPDGEPFQTPYAGNWLLPVRQGGAAAMLKLSKHPEDRRGAETMAWWAGDGAAKVLAHDPEALLLERLAGRRSLADMARSGEDDEASRILCTVADRLHAPRPEPPANLLPLGAWLRALKPAADAQGGLLRDAQATLERLLAADEEPCVLHGDLHHANVLDGGDRGWLAIDPKGVRGPRGYDYANILCNPDGETALAPGRMQRQARIVAEAARLPVERLLQWLLVHAAIAGVWCLQDGFDATAALDIAAMARAALNP